MLVGVVAFVVFGTVRFTKRAPEPIRPWYEYQGPSGREYGYIVAAGRGGGRHVHFLTWEGERFRAKRSRLRRYL
jgi:hypothetical protein